MRLLAVVAGLLLLTSCSSRSDEPAHRMLASTASPPPNLRWLTAARQERLADTVSTLSKEHGWAAGCVFRWNATEDALEALDRPAGTAGISVLSDPQLQPAAILFVEGPTKAGGSYREVVPDGITFCYVPE